MAVRWEVVEGQDRVRGPPSSQPALLLPYPAWALGAEIAAAVQERRALGWTGVVAVAVRSGRVWCVLKGGPGSVDVVWETSRGEQPGGWSPTHWDGGAGRDSEETSSGLQVEPPGLEARLRDLSPCPCLKPRGEVQWPRVSTGKEGKEPKD